MKSSFKFILISFGVFVVLVGVIFVVLMIIDPSPDESPVPEEKIATVESDNPEDTASKQSSQDQAVDDQSAPISLLDSLNNRIQELTNNLFVRSLEIDSLNEQITFKEGLITGYRKTIDKLNEQVLARNKKEINLKELAKTYESMKVADIKPILNKVDDETVMAIYRAMGARTRKSIMMALSAERAATITQKLAGITEEKS
ncbi:MAG: hypothetical protein GXO90_04415 [FCB group bacterium]|nr:hypothetical protein [FCB group bacterium]